MREIEAFGDHLRADQDIDLPLPERIQDFFVGIPFLCGVRVQARDPGAWKKTGHFAFDLFCPEPHEAEKRRFALAADRRNFFLVIAIVAQQEILLLMERERDLAVLAFFDLGAGGAADRGGGPARRRPC